MSTAYICQMNELLGRRLLFQALIGYLPLPDDLERQSVLCALVGSSSPWLSSLIAKCWLSEASSMTVRLHWGCLLQGWLPWPTGHWQLLFHTCFYFWLSLLGHCFDTAISPFTLVPTGQDRETSSSLPSPRGLSLISIHTLRVPVSCPVITESEAVPLHQNV